jgi:hypothetical protein
MNTQNKIKASEAQEALLMMEASERELRSLETKDAGGYFLIWGVIYILVPLLVLFAPHQAPWAANMLIVIGAISTGVLGSRSPVRSELGDRIWTFWVVAFAFAPIWIIILGGNKFPDLSISLDSRQVWAFGVTIAMLVYVLMGLVFKSKLLIGLGFGITALTLAAFFVAWEPTAFWTWMAVFTGGPLFIAGVLCRFGKSR